MSASLLCILFAHACRALDPHKATSQYIHDIWGTGKGFIGGTIHAICQSNDGYLWIGTDRGLVRFDGFNFTLVQQPLSDTPPLGSIHGLANDAEGNLWIRPEDPHVTLYHDGKFEDAAARFNLLETTFTAMSREQEGGILFSGPDSHAFRLRNGKADTIADADKLRGTIISLAETRDGKFWIGTQDDGLFRVSEQGVSKPVPGLVNTKINALLPGNGSGLWVGTDRGLLFWDGKEVADKELVYPLHTLQILSMLRDRSGNIWVGTNHGLIRITEDGPVSLDPLKTGAGSEVTAIFEDRDGDVWYGGSGGLERLRDGMFATYSVAEGLPSANNGPLYVDSEGRTWFAPLSGGLYWLKDGQVRRVRIAGLDNDIVYSISGGAGEVWVGRQNGGLTVLTAVGESFAARTYTEADGLAQNSVYSVHRSRDGTVWAGTVSAGLSRLKDDRFTHYSVANGLTSDTVNSIVEAKDGTMWFATPNGLDSFAKERWKSISTSDGLPSARVRSIFEDSKQVLWAATDGGLAFLSSERAVLARNLPESLSEEIFGMAEDGLGGLWFATSDHVLQVNREGLLAGSLDPSEIQSYGIADGLPGLEGVRRDRSMIADSQGRIWISLNRGLAVGDPGLILRNSTQPVVRIESISAGEVQMDWRDSLKLAAGTRTIVFNYAGTNLSTPDRIKYRYKLDGSDQGWSRVIASRQVVFTNLGPGPYRFHIIASNGEGLWNGAETTVPFVIERTFWQTWWFRVSCVLGFLLAAVLLYQLRVLQLTRQLNIRFQERLMERTRIAQELHDTLLQGVISASMQLDLAEEQLTEDSAAKPLLRRVLQLMGHVTEEGRNALRGLRTSDNSNRTLELEFSRLREELAIDEGIDYRVVVHGEVRLLCPVVRDEVYRIGREALTNAVLHSKADRIEMEVEYANKSFRLLVRDDGCGMDSQVLQSGREGHWGLTGMRERSERIAASLKLKSRIGAGTEVELTIPGAIAFQEPSNRSLRWWLPGRNRQRQRQVKTTGGMHE